MGENWDFSGFFLTSAANPRFYVRNGGWCVNLRGLGDMDKIKASKNVVKRGKNEQKLAEIHKNARFFGKNS